MNTQTLTTDMRGRVHKTYDEPIEKVYWQIREVAEMFDVATSAIRFWEVHFGIEVMKRKGGKRQFTKEDIDRFRQVHHLLKVEGYTIEGAKRKLRNG